MLGSFTRDLTGEGVVAALRDGLIGEGMTIDGPFGPQKLLYADYAASGRALRQVETFIAERVLPYYANSHTEASFCGAAMNRLRAEARAAVARATGADQDCAVMFTGSGATAAVNRLVKLTGLCAAVGRGERATVFIGPYEHHSNILPWRECGAEVIEIPEAETGGPDIARLETALAERQDGRLLVGAFSAASNVTGVVTDADAVTRVLKRFGALAIWDYAAAGPYLPIAMNGAQGEAPKDAIFISPHKFPGGPASSGVLVMRRSAARSDTPTWPGGGTVSFVSPWGHDYAETLQVREEAGTPNVIGDIRAALAFLIKEAVGADVIHAREEAFRRKAEAAWRGHERLELLGVDKPERLPIFSFRVRDAAGALIHHQLITRQLSDRFGVQARGGCACAGPYAHRLLGLDQDASEELRRRIHAGEELEKPGWTRVNFSYLMNDDDAERIIHAVATVARDAGEYACRYVCCPKTARFEAAA